MCWGNERVLIKIVVIWMTWWQCSRPYSADVQLTREHFNRNHVWPEITQVSYHLFLRIFCYSKYPIILLWLLICSLSVHFGWLSVEWLLEVTQICLLPPPLLIRFGMKLKLAHDWSQTIHSTISVHAIICLVRYFCSTELCSCIGVLCNSFGQKCSDHN